MPGVLSETNQTAVDLVGSGDRGYRLHWTVFDPMALPLSRFQRLAVLRQRYPQDATWRFELHGYIPSAVDFASSTE